MTTLSAIKKKNVIKCYNEKWPINNIASHFKIGKKRVYKILEEADVIIRRQRTISEEDTVAIIDLYDKKWPRIKIANYFNIWVGSVIKILKDNEVKIRKQKIIPKKVIKKIINLYIDEKKNLAKIAELLDISQTFVYNTLKKNKIHIRSMAELCKEKQNYSDEEIIELYNSGLCINKITEKIGTSSHQKIYKILRSHNILQRHNNENAPAYEKYRAKVMWLTKKQNIQSLPNYDKRGVSGLVGAYHLDHKFSISEGFIIGIKPEIIANINNLEFIPWQKNISKRKKCSINLEELCSKINQTQNGE